MQRTALHAALQSPGIVHFTCSKSSSSTHFSPQQVVPLGQQSPGGLQQDTAACMHSTHDSQYCRTSAAWQFSHGLHSGKKRMPAIGLHSEISSEKCTPAASRTQALQSLKVSVYRALALHRKVLIAVEIACFGYLCGYRAKI